MKAVRSLLTAVSLALALAMPAQAQTDVAGVGTTSILQTTLAGFPSCVKWRPTGVCFFLYCTMFGCTIRTSIKVSHYVPDAIVSSYNDPTTHPWNDYGKWVAGVFSGAGSSLLGLRLDATADTARENTEISTFKTTDAIGNPLAQFLAMASGSGSAAIPSTVPIPTPEELMKFPGQEVPRIVQLWATVPAQMGNSMAEDWRALASNPGGLLSGLGSLPGAFSSAIGAVGGAGGMIGSGGFGGTGGGGGAGGGSLGGGGTGGGGDGLDPGSLQDVIRSVGGGEGGDLFCPGGSSAFGIHFQSDLDGWFWRSMLPLDLLYPQSWIPGYAEVGHALVNTWGNVYPRSGELVQSHPAKSSAVLSQRVQSILSQSAQAHIYAPFKTPGGYVYFAKFADPMWQPVFPVPETNCITFGENDSLGVFSWHDFKTSSTYGYIWNLWQRYECCKSRGIFLFSIP